MSKIVTIFKNIKETNTPFHKDILFILDRIKQGTHKDLIKKIRKTADKSQRNEFKQSLPAICFSGKFSKRNKESLVQHSGFICLDFDGYNKQKELLQDKDRFCKNNYVYSCFVSPSGNGLKVIIKIPAEADNHVNYFKALEVHFDSPHFDKSCKDISRVCYESYDPLIYVNENSNTWDIFADIEYKELSKLDEVETIPIMEENKIVDILMSWWTKRYPMSEGARNQNCYILAMAFNDYGINKTIAQFVLHQYESSDFSKREIDRTIESAYKNTANFGSKYYEDDSAVNRVRDMKRKGYTRREIRKEFSKDNVDPNAVDAVIDRIDDDNKNKSFWKAGKNGKISIVHIAFKEFLEERGFYKFCPEGGNNYVFVKVENNLVDHTTENAIKDDVLSYLLELGDSQVYNYFADKTRFFKEDFLSMLATIDIYFVEDTKDVAYLYYKNGAVTINKNSVELIDYFDLGGYVWKDHVIDRNYKKCNGRCDYETFIENICAKDLTRVESMRSTIGFMMQGHKNQSFCPAIILNDEVISDNPEGGTGKGLFMNALGHMKKVVTIDGKSFNFEKSFAYQLVSADTQILVFDDVKKNFDFERLFSVVTEGLTLEKKNKDAIKIPFEKSPKIAITTNYAIKGAGNSFARRKWELELHQYYNKTYTPLTEFGRLMFGDWNENDWCRFDNYMIRCLQLYMREGLMESKFVNLKVRQLSAETCHDFIEWCGLIEGQKGTDKVLLDSRVYKNNLYGEFVDEYPDYAPKAKMSISRTKFYKWLHSYAIFKTSQMPEEGRDIQGRWMIIRTK
jgi:hypothetical protein